MALFVTHFARAAFWISTIAICVLIFAWPFAISPDPGQPLFKVFAIAVLLVFLLSMLVLLAQRLASRG